MIALIQRVSQASVSVAGAVVSQIDQGLLVLLCAQRGDTEREADRLLDKLMNYRVFADEQGKMNLSAQAVGAALLVVSQFTLAADTRSGTRPSFGPAADPVTAEHLYNYFVAQAQSIAATTGIKIGTGVFGADMAVQLTNDGPVTFWLEVTPPQEKS